MKMKKILAIVITIAIVLSTMGFSALAEDSSDVVNISASNADFAEVIASAKDKDVVGLSENVTVDTSFTVADGVVIDLGQHTMYINVENSYFNNVTIKNGNIVLGKDDVHVCDGYFLVNEGKTLTLNGVNISSSAEGMKAYTVFHLYSNSNLNIEGSLINVANNEYEGSIIYADNVAPKVTVTGSKIIGNNVGRGTVYASVTMTNSEVELTKMEHGFNGSNLVFNDTKVNISNGSGRGITLGRVETTTMKVNGNSVVTVTDMSEAGILFNDASSTMEIAPTARVIADDVRDSNGEVNLDAYENITGIIETPDGAINLIKATGDIARDTYTWNYTDKILTLNNSVIAVADEYAVKVPDGSTVIVNGTNTISGSTVAGIYAPGSLTIKGVDTACNLNITAQSGYAVFGDADVSDIVIEGITLTADRDIYSSKSDGTNGTRNSIIIKNSVVNVAETSINANCLNGSSIVNIDGSEVTAGHINSGAHVMNYVNSTSKLTVNDSTLNLKGTYHGNYASNLVAWGTSGVDVDITDSVVSTWNRGWKGSSVEFQGGKDIDVDITGSSFYMYAWWSEIRVRRYYDNTCPVDVNIQDTTMVYNSKKGGAGLNIVGSTDQGGITTISSDTSYINYNCMYGEDDERVEITVVGNPTIKKPFIATNQVGSCYYTESDFNLRLNENQTLVIDAEGSVELPEGSGIVLSSTSKLLVKNGASVENVEMMAPENFSVISEASVNGDTLYYVVNSNPEKIEVSFEEIYTDENNDGVDDDGIIDYNIVLKAGKNEIINRLNSVDLTFINNSVAVSDGEIGYKILEANDEIMINNVYDPTNDYKEIPDRYEFHYKNKDQVRTDTDNSVIIGKVVFDGYGQLDFTVKDVDTNIVNATTTKNNIVASYIPSPVNTDKEGKLDYGDKVVNGVIDDYIEIPTQDLTIVVSFPNAIEDNKAAYQAMTITVKGNRVDETIKLGSDETELMTDKDVVYYTATIADKLVKNTPYTVKVEGEGYRTATYTVSMTEDKVINFWNNVMDNDVYVEEAASGNKNPQKVTFLAGDIVKDDDINVYDLSAVVSYFGQIELNAAGTAHDYAKYDLNRDGRIDSKDVAYVLVSWGN